LLPVLAAGAETNTPPPDGWLTNAFTWPDFVGSPASSQPDFESLRAETSGGRLKIFWSPSALDTNASVQFFVSADSPGHWPARDWRGYGAAAHDTNWEARIPVDDVDVPLVYFAAAARAGATNYSPPRITLPRALGLEEPTRIFWPFVEGFEEGPGSWRLASDAGSLRLTSEAKHGKAALLLTLPAGKKAVSVGTTRLRGWKVMQHGIRGFSVWLRTRQGTATARFALHADTFTPQHARDESQLEVRISNHWQRVDVPFDSFPQPPPAGLDWVTFEFVADGPREILLDDLQYLGPWELDAE
jgi:hypothetical protein